MQKKKSALADVSQLHKQEGKAKWDIEEKYRLMVDNAAEGIVITQEGILKFVNPSVAHFLGCSRKELISKPFVNFVHPEDREMVMGHHVRKLRGEEKRGIYTFRFIDKNGNLRWVENNSVIITWEGKPATLNFLSDITARKKAGNDLQEAKNLLSNTFSALQDLVVVIDKDLRVRMSNWKDYEFISEKDRQDNPYCYEVFMHRKKPCNPCHAMEVFATGEIKQREHTNPIDGKIRDIRVIPIFDDEGKVVAVIEHLRDITERKQAEEALRVSQQRFKSIFENAPIGFYRTTPDGRILDANPALIQMLGYASFEELAAVNLETQEYHPEYSRRQFKERIERNGEIKGLESFWKRPDDTLVYIRENVRIVRDADGNTVCYEGTIEDITDRKHSEEQIRSLSQQLIKAHEDERHMISRELHDRVAQDLSTLKIVSETFFDNQPAASSEIRQRVSEFSKILERTILAVRDLTYDLRPPGLDDMGLILALSIYCEEFAEKSGVMVDFQAHGIESLTLNFNTEVNLYRLIQEGLNNIRKHADAARAIVRLVGSFPNLILRIEDDGKGFDIQERIRAADSEKRMGLRSMAERVNLLQGQMKIQSRLEKGTKIEIKLPYHENKDDSKNDHLDHR